MVVNPQCRPLPDKSGRGPFGKRQEAVELDFSEHSLTQSGGWGLFLF